MSRVECSSKSPHFALTEATVIRQIFSSDTFRNGGVGSIGLESLSKRSSESALIVACRHRECRLARIGTDYIVWDKRLDIKFLL